MLGMGLLLAAGGLFVIRDMPIDAAPLQNLIANPEVSMTSGQSPSDWYKGGWGEYVASLSYDLGEGHGDSRSLLAEVESIGSGDVKWFHEAVKVVEGTVYRYSDWYKANVGTHIIAEYQDGRSRYRYEHLTYAPESEDEWKLAEVSWTIPRGFTKVTVFHVLDQVGWLRTDSFSLVKQGVGETVELPELPEEADGSKTFVAPEIPTISEAPGIPEIPETSIVPESPNIPELPDIPDVLEIPETPGVPEEKINLVINGDLETMVDSGPLGWTRGGWGSNTAEFSYDEHSGNNSLKVTVSDYISGDAKWMGSDVALAAGKTYQFSVWYKTNIEPGVVVRYTMDDGSERYVSLSRARFNAEAATVWQLYAETFVVPEGTRSVNVFMLISENGWLMTDDYEISDFVPEKFDRSLLTMMFDDGYIENVSTAMPMLDAYGFKSSHCYMTSRLDSQEAIDGLLALDRGGHEICGHTITHPDLTTLTAEKLHEELAGSQAVLEGYLGKAVDVFVSPYGSYNALTLDKIDDLYRSHRGTNEGYNTKDNFDVYNTKVRNVFLSTTAEEIASWVREAQEGGYWLILLYHMVGNYPDEYGTTPGMFAEHLRVIDDSGIAVKTYSDALDEVLGQVL